MKIALVHDYLSQDGGAERVVDAMQDIWPEAPLFTLFHDKKNAHPRFLRRKIETSFLQNIPLLKKKYQWFLPLMPIATETYDLSEFDIVVSSTSAFAKGIITSPSTTHICYCHTPTRYLWTDTKNYIEEMNHPKFIKKFIPFFLTKLRIWDKIASERVDYFIANSQTVSDRIKKYYNRDSRVIFPPVDVHKFKTQSSKGDFFLIGGRLVPYKRYDIAVKACTRIGAPLVVFGDGPQKAELEKMAGHLVKFVGKISDEAKIKLYANSKAFIHPQIEDFGITPIEAMAAGKPVIAYKKGGACETVIENKTGLFFREQSWESLAHTLLNFDENLFEPEEIRNHALKFSRYAFKKQMREFVENIWMKKQNLIDKNNIVVKMLSQIKTQTVKQTDY